jgi:hypothetical protein
MYTVGTFLHFMSGNAKSNLNVEILKCFLKCYEGTNQGWIQHDLVGGGARVVSVMCAVRPSTCLTTAKSFLTIVFEL